MTNIAILAAIATNHAIGFNNKLLWNIPSDLKRFKDRTKDGVVIMGRKTWDSLPVKPLPNRSCIVISRYTHIENSTYTTSNLNEAIEKARHIQKGSVEKQEQIAEDNDPTLGEERIFIIGGQSIYDQAILHPEVRTMYISHVDFTPAQADTFFPIINSKHWEVAHTLVQIDPIDVVGGSITYTEKKYVRKI